MKINEKNLSGFAVSNSPIDKDGWLLKRGEVNKSFQRRWFVLKGNMLFYFEKKTDKEPAGLIILEGCTIELAEYEEQYAFKIVFHGAGDRTYILGADSQETMESWMKALACASYDYMKLMVSELQRQLDEIIELEKAHVSIFEEQPEQQSSKVNTLTKTEIKDAKVSSEAIAQLPSVKQRHRRAPGLPPGQRINPFNRCQSEEHVEKSSYATSQPGSAPGTPQCHRYGTSLKSYEGRPRRTEELLHEKT